MHVHDSVPIKHPHKAFHALTSRESGKLFRDIGEYTSYETKGNQIHVSYPTLWGRTQVVLRPAAMRLTFEGRAPLGVGFGGSWTYVDGAMVLEQHVWGVPWGSGSIVRKRVARALEDLAAASA
jgi:hypothetical protein